MWEGRYKSSLVASDDYFFTVSRYIELNPVRAKMVDQLGDYPCSSVRHNGMGLNIGLISEHELYKQLGTTPSARLIAYRNLFAREFSAGILDEVRLHSTKGLLTGHE